MMGSRSISPGAAVPRSAPQWDTLGQRNAPHLKQQVRGVPSSLHFVHTLAPVRAVRTARPLGVEGQARDCALVRAVVTQPHQPTATRRGELAPDRLTGTSAACIMAAVITTLEHLDSCARCSRRTLHRRVINRDAGGVVVGDVRACVVCASREAGVAPGNNPVLAMKEARSLKRRPRIQANRKRTRRTGY
jgi:hypothetical protein